MTPMLEKVKGFFEPINRAAAAAVGIGQQPSAGGTEGSGCRRVCWVGMEEVRKGFGGVGRWRRLGLRKSQEAVGGGQQGHSYMRCAGRALLRLLRSHVQCGLPTTHALLHGSFIAAFNLPVLPLIL